MRLCFKILLISVIYFHNYQIYAQGLNQLIGKWESVDMNDQIGTQIEFKENNKFILIHILIADYKYVLNGNILISYLEKDTPVKKVLIDTSYLEIKPDTIVRRYNRVGWKDTVIMIRDKSFDGNSDNKENVLIGKWKWVYPAGDTATSIFYNSGLWHFYVPQNYSTGNYSVIGDTITINFDNNKNKQVDTYWVEGNLLRLKNLNMNKESLFRRVQ